jgi:hypothetical protein
MLPSPGSPPSRKGNPRLGALGILVRYCTTNVKFTVCWRAPLTAVTTTG